METTTLERPASQQEIPKSLIYEEIDGKPFYYRNWKKVLNQQKKLEEIMGCSGITLANF